MARARVLKISALETLERAVLWEVSVLIHAGGPQHSVPKVDCKTAIDRELFVKQEALVLPPGDGEELLARLHCIFAGALPDRLGEERWPGLPVDYFGHVLARECFETVLQNAACGRGSESARRDEELATLRLLAHVEFVTVRLEGAEATNIGVHSPPPDALKQSVSEQIRETGQAAFIKRPGVIPKHSFRRQDLAGIAHDDAFGHPARLVIRVEVVVGAVFDERRETNEFEPGERAAAPVRVYFEPSGHRGHERGPHVTFLFMRSRKVAKCAREVTCNRRNFHRSVHAGMKIFGVTLVRGEADIIAVTIRYHLQLGLDGVFVLDMPLPTERTRSWSNWHRLMIASAGAATKGNISKRS